MLFLKCVAEMILEDPQRSDAEAKRSQLGELLHEGEAWVSVLGNGLCGHHW